MADFLCCGFCGQGFALNSLTDFIDHKIKGCSNGRQFTFSLLECYYCDLRYLSPLEVITHVQMNHGVKVVKLISWPSVNLETGETKCITPPFSQNCRDTKHDEGKTVSSIVDKGLSFSSERLGNQCKLIHQEQGVGEGEKVSRPVTTPRCWTSGCGVKCNGPVTRKTCCLIDGGPPCTQFEACPIVETSLCGSSPDSSGKQNQPAPSEQSCNELDAHDSSLPEADRNTSNCVALAESRSVFKCQFCTSEFKQKIHLQKHMMSVHLEQKPYKCNFCDYKTVEKSHLKIHLRRHTGERPYACLLCNYRAAQHITLKQHCLKKHRNAFVSCQRCNMRFVTLNQLNKHEKFCCT
ncbi:hypothetical protein CSKR_204053 [Clonorchis sinensis]|uniref:C2H2-type domain-containing protein n=1 Tax=Clonorchis sinensis TaxID=79923 RepID=A0A8T1M220_CLOSI|nr:hypothetical protein CSKR_204053 [Clonorchis sinensis]